MFKKLSLGSLAASLLLVGALMFGNSFLVSQSLADVIDKVREITSYQAKMRFETQIEPDKPPVEQTSILYWKASGAQRMDSAVKSPGRPVPSKTIDIRFPDKPGISLDLANKSFRVLPAAAGRQSPLMAMEQLAKYRGDAAKNLGEKRIDETDCYGFSIALREVDENILGGTMEVWVDENTDLPFEIRMNVFPGVSMVTYGFQWNQEFDASVFDATAPEDFVEMPDRQPKSDEKMAEEIIAALQIYSKHSGGTYPPVTVIYGDVIAVQLRKIAGLGNPPYTKEQIATDLFQELGQSSTGFAHMTVLMRDSADAEFFGKTVGPSDDDKVLFRWRRADGKMQAIYGDLSTRTE